MAIRSHCLAIRRGRQYREVFSDLEPIEELRGLPDDEVF